MRNEKNDLRTAKHGGIEGLPLMLLIMIVIAAVGLGILMMWLNSVDDMKQISRMYVIENTFGGRTVKSIGVSPLDFHNAEGYYDLPGREIIPVAVDGQDNPLGGVTFTWTGCGLEGSEVMGDVDAPITFGGVVVLPFGVQQSHISFMASKDGYGDANLQVPVIRAEEGAPIYE